MISSVPSSVSFENFAFKHFFLTLNSIFLHFCINAIQCGFTFSSPEEVLFPHLSRDFKYPWCPLKETLVKCSMVEDKLWDVINNFSLIALPSFENMDRDEEHHCLSYSTTIPSWGLGLRPTSGLRPSLLESVFCGMVEEGATQGWLIKVLSKAGWGSQSSTKEHVL